MIFNFSEKMKLKQEWQSDPFFNCFLERIYVYAYPSGYGDGEGTHMSNYLYLMKGPHDEEANVRNI